MDVTSKNLININFESVFKILNFLMTFKYKYIFICPEFIQSSERLCSSRECHTKSQLYFLGSIDVAKFYVRVSFSFFDQTFETKLPWQSPAGVKTGILKKRMKTVANETCFEVPRKNRLVHVAKNWLEPALYCVLQVVARYFFKH